MDIGPNLGVSDPAPFEPAARAPQLPAAAQEAVDVGKRFEQLLWAEMLTHAGLEKSLTLGGGESASAFSRYVVEEIAADIAENHPLGLSNTSIPYEQL